MFMLLMMRGLLPGRDASNVDFARSRPRLILRNLGPPPPQRTWKTELDSRRRRKQFVFAPCSVAQWGQRQLARRGGVDF